MPVLRKGSSIKVGLAVSMGEAAKHVFFQGFQIGFNILLCGRCGTSWHFYVVEKCWKSLCVTDAILLQGFKKISCFVAGAALWILPSWFRVAGAAHWIRRVLLRVFCESHCQGCMEWWQRANRVAGERHRADVIDILRGKGSVWRKISDTLRFTLHPPHFTLYTLVFTLYILHSATSTLHFTLYTPHFTPYTLISTLYTLLPPAHTRPFTLYPLHPTRHTLHFIPPLYTLHFTLPPPPSPTHFTLYTPRITL